MLVADVSWEASWTVGWRPQFPSPRGRLWACGLPRLPRPGFLERMAPEKQAEALLPFMTSLPKSHHVTSAIATALLDPGEAT